jgi:YVTN family beta-propeller protein
VARFVSARAPFLGAKTLGCAVLLVGFAVSALLIKAQALPPVPPSPGAMSDGTILLPNGWRLSPAGRHLPVGTLPLNVVQTPDSKYLIVTNNGLATPSLTIVDIASWTVKTSLSMDNAWYGLVWNSSGTRLYSAGADQNSVQELSYADGALTPSRTIALPAAAGSSFAGGLAISPDGKTLYVTSVFAMTVSAIDLTSGLVSRTVQLDVEPYTTTVSLDGRSVYVSLWGGARVQVFDARTLTLTDEWQTGEHPNAMALSLDGKRLFVACGSSSEVDVYDTFSGSSIEVISVRLFPEAPPTATPNSLALSPDGKTLLVADADDNAIAVVDVSNSGRSFVEGFIPTGWYPTGAIFGRDGKQIFILSGRGMTPAPNTAAHGPTEHLIGTISVVPTPDRGALADLTRQVYALTPYSDAIRLSPASVPVASPIPIVVGGSSPIKYVFYIIRENRTYDSILGDVKQGNGDPKLTLFPADVTPNAHALAKSFVLFDNFYVDADVTADGHPFSTAAYATDFVEKLWQTLYGHRGGIYLSEGGGFMRTPFGNVTAPGRGYIWDFAQRARVSVRSYGEFVLNTLGANGVDQVSVAAVPGLTGAVAPAFPGFDLSVTDNHRVDAWLGEFLDYEANGQLPRLSIIHLPNDHTYGATPGKPTPRAMLGDNDYALGRIVEAISNGPYWSSSAVFVLEDDAQDGPDHVDSHRSVMLVASPFARRGFVDHGFYTTSGVLRTIELILGLEPMSEYDAAAVPLYAAFQPTPDLATYASTHPNVAFDELNAPSAYGAAESLRMNFSNADLTPEQPLNEIIWKSVKGASSPMPPPRRSAFIIPRSRETPGEQEPEER